MPEREVLGQILQLGAVAGVGARGPLADDRQEDVVDRGADAVRQLIELVDAQIVRAPFHVGRGERDPERLAQRGNVLEVDLFLEVLRAGGDEHALAAENRGHEIRERLAGAGAGFGEQDAAVLEDARDGRGHLDLAGARLEIGHGEGKRAAGAKAGLHGVRVVRSPSPRAAQAPPLGSGTAGTSGTASRLRREPSRARGRRPASAARA